MGGAARAENLGKSGITRGGHISRGRERACVRASTVETVGIRDAAHSRADRFVLGKPHTFGVDSTVAPALVTDRRRVAATRPARFAVLLCPFKSTTLRCGAHVSSFHPLLLPSNTA